MKSILFLYSNQLFHHSLIPHYIDEVYVLEHPKFYDGGNNMNFNKKKIILHRASILAYIDTYSSYHYISYEHFKYPSISKNTSSLYVFDVVDYTLQNELCSKYTNLTILDTPMFLNTLENLIEDDITNHSTFYKKQLKRYDIKKVDKTYDTENRNPIPKQHSFDFKSLDYEYTKNQEKYIKKAKQFCEKHFKHNYGTIDNFYMPVTRKNAIQWMNDFFECRFKYFGKYQDAIIPNQPLLFHSLCSPLLNIGLITPKDVLNKLQHTKAPIQTYEGFLRQLIGWREFERLLYARFYNDIVGKNYFNHKRKINKSWYEGTTGITPVDITIKKAFKYGYLHHIERLMIMSNIMNLCRLKPEDVYQWFMEFSIDSYEWVMVGCVYSMGLWSDGGVSMRKPYISSSNYIDKMSNSRFVKDGWRDIWDALFYDFIVTYKKQLNNTSYKRNLYHWNRKSKKEQKDIQELASNFLRNS